MCGRFYLDAHEDELMAYFGLSSLPDVEPRYNIAPSQSILALVADAKGREGRLFRWGLIPFWAKDAKFGYRTINARSETVAEKPAFRAAFKHRRCLIPATGYFEWKAVADGKQPYCIRFPETPVLAFAGLYEQWQSPQGEAIDSCTIIVTAAAPAVAAIHDRMPVCFNPDQFTTWLDPAVQDLPLLKSLIDESYQPEVEIFPVTRRMNNPRYASPDAIQPLS